MFKNEKPSKENELINNYKRHCQLALKSSTSTLTIQSIKSLLSSRTLSAQIKTDTFISTIKENDFPDTRTFLGDIMTYMDGATQGVQDWESTEREYFLEKLKTLFSDWRSEKKITLFEEKVLINSCSSISAQPANGSLSKDKEKEFSLLGKRSSPDVINNNNNPPTKKLPEPELAIFITDEEKPAITKNEIQKMVPDVEKNAKNKTKKFTQLLKELYECDYKHSYMDTPKSQKLYNTITTSLKNEATPTLLNARFMFNNTRQAHTVLSLGVILPDADLLEFCLSLPYQKNLDIQSKNPGLTLTEYWVNHIFYGSNLHYGSKKVEVIPEMMARKIFALLSAGARLWLSISNCVSLILFFLPAARPDSKSAELVNALVKRTNMEDRTYNGETCIHLLFADLEKIKLNAVKLFILHNAKLDVLNKNNETPIDIYLKKLENSFNQAYMNKNDHEEIISYLLSEHISFDQFENLQKKQLLFAIVAINSIKLLQSVMGKNLDNLAKVLVEEDDARQLLDIGFRNQSIGILRYIFEKQEFILDVFNKYSIYFFENIIKNKEPIKDEFSYYSQAILEKTHKNFFRLLRLFLDFNSTLNAIDNSKINAMDYTPAQIISMAVNNVRPWVVKFNYTMTYLSIHKQQNTFFSKKQPQEWKALFMKTVIKEEENTKKSLLKENENHRFYI